MKPEIAVERLTTELTKLTHRPYSRDTAAITARAKSALTVATEVVGQITLIAEAAEARAVALEVEVLALAARLEGYESRLRLVEVASPVDA